MSNTLASLSDQLVATVSRSASLAVAVEGSRRTPASGVIWRPGIVVTVDHAIKREEGITVTLPDGKAVPATLAGRDPGTDIAVLRAETGDPEFAVAPAGGAQPGSIVLAVGRSSEVGPHTALGVISAVRGSWRTWRGGRIDRYLRLDISFYPGLSGSVVVDTEGRVIGLGTSALSRIAGVAIPAETVVRVLDEVLLKGYVSRAYLGVGVQPVALPGNSAGLMIVSLEDDAPASRGGLLLGDILLAAGERELHDIDDLQDALQGRQAGESVPVRLSRGGEAQTLDVTLGERARRTE